MQFAGSAHLDAMYSPAPKESVRSAVQRVLSIFGPLNGETVEELSSQSIDNATLRELIKWSERIEYKPGFDLLGQAAAKYWAAQTLATTVMSSNALDPIAHFSTQVSHLMEMGADGLFCVGRNQFHCLYRACKSLMTWVVAQRPDSVALIESPLGNSLPVQILNDIAIDEGITTEIVVWSAPRNDKPARGRTVKTAAKECAETVKEHDYVIFMDEAVTGSRFVNLFDALATKIPKGRLLPVALLLDHGSRHSSRRDRLVSRLESHQLLTRFESSLVEMPPLRPFSVDNLGPVKWANPLIWADSDLAAGKRKVNLLFTILEHCFDQLDQLGGADHSMRTYLEQCWREDSSGQALEFAPGLMQTIFRDIGKDLPLSEVREIVIDRAKQAFPLDYEGKIARLVDADVRARWEWFRENFLSEALHRIDQGRAWMAWRAIDATFAASHQGHRPRASRDHDYGPYTIPLNPTLRALNLHLRALIAGKVF